MMARRQRHGKVVGLKRCPVRLAREIHLLRPHQFPAEIIRHADWLYLRFTLSYRDVEELLAERGLDVSYVSIGSEL